VCVIGSGEVNSRERDTGPEEQRLWDYLDGDEFRGRLTTMTKALRQDDDALLAEERAHKRWWDARAERIGTTRAAIHGIEDNIDQIAVRPPRNALDHEDLLEE
jgi:hypothetical protein